MHIREVFPGDAAALKELYLSHLTANPPAEKMDDEQWIPAIHQIIDDPDYHLLVCEENGQIVSTVTLVIIKNLTHNFRPYAVMENVVTHADFRKKGYATALISRATKIASDCRCYKIMLMTGSKKEATLRFYEKNGFNREEKTAFIKRL